MKKCIIILISVIANSLATDAQSWQWAKQGESTSVDDLNYMCTDYNGNVYMIGEFGHAGLGTYYIVFDTDTVFNLGFNQIFLVKYSAGGSVLWAKGIGGNNPISAYPLYEHGNLVTFDSTTNSVIITGHLVGGYNFGGTVLIGTNDLFIAKLDTGGNFQWARKVTPSYAYISSNAIVSDEQGNIYLSGTNIDTAQFGGFSVPPGGFLAKYDAAGNCIWAHQKFISCTALKIIPYDDDLFILGMIFNDTAVVDTFNYYSSISANLFFARYDTSGNRKWLVIPSSNSSIGGLDLDCDNMGNMYLLGNFIGNIIFDNDSLISPGTIDFFLTRFDANGNVIWMRQGHSSDSARGFQVSTIGDGSVHMAGTFTGSIVVGNFSLASTVNNSIFYAGYDASGNCMGAGQLDAALYQPFSLRLATLGNGEFFLAGPFDTPISIGSTQLTPVLASDVFLAKHDAITGLGGGEREANYSLHIYANPTTGKCNITVPDDLANERYLELVIYDNTGRVLQQKVLEMHEGTIRVNLEAEAKGIYQVTLGNGKKRYSGTIVFE
jgi:hypothetical protein